MENVLLENYKKSILQKYCAVCLDIDGTITKDKSSELDERIIHKIAELLKEEIPVIFITGRGELGIEEAITQMIPILIEQYSLTNHELSKMYALANDGARLFAYDETTNKVLGNRKYISPEESLRLLNKLNNEILEYINKSNLKDICDISYSTDSKNNIIINIRLEFKNEYNYLTQLLLEKINNLLKTKYQKLNVTKGKYRDSTVYQIGTTTKNEAIRQLENIIEIPKEYILRIGDCGNLEGNDFSMLDCHQGFSTDKTSGKSDCCFPIFDDKNEILKGSKATIHLLNKIQFTKLKSTNKCRRKTK